MTGRTPHFILVVIAAVLMSACDGGGSLYTIGGSVAGLDDGEELVLQNNLRDDLTISENASFTFSRWVADGGLFL